MGTYGFHAQHRKMVLMCLLTNAIMLYLYTYVLSIELCMYLCMYLSGGGGGDSLPVLVGYSKLYIWVCLHFQYHSRYPVTDTGLMAWDAAYGLIPRFSKSECP